MNIQLSDDQNKAFNKFKNGENLFITGPAGTGKSILIKFIKDFCLKNSIEIYITAMTGCAALLIDGITLHSWAGIFKGSDDIDILIKKIRRNKEVKSKWQNTNILIIDEISMLSGNFLDKLNEIAKIIRKNKNPFGGIQIIFVGDLFQLEPIYDESEEPKFCFEASCWNECIDNIIELRKIMRQDNSIFQKCLNEIRIGEISEDTKKILFKCSKKKLKNINSNIIPTRLYSCNKDVERINNEELIKLKNDIKEYLVESKISINKTNNYSIENDFLEMISNNLDKNSQYINKLELAIGAQVMLIKNIDTENGLVNGSRGIIVCFNNNDYPVVKFINGVEKEIEPIPWQFDFNDRFKIKKNKYH